MSLIKLYPQQDTFISLANPNNNYGANEILYLSVSSSSSAIQDLNRILIQWDLTPQSYINAVSAGASSYTATLNLYNAKNGQFTDENFNIELYPLTATWNEGQFSRMWSGTGFANWNSATYFTNWSISEGSYSSSPSISINFPKGTENLTANVSAFIEYWRNAPNYGFMIKLSTAQESATGVSGSYYNLKTFFGKDTHTLFQPSILIQNNTPLLQDDAGNLRIGNLNFFIYDTNVSTTAYPGIAGLKADLFATGFTGYTINYFAPYQWYINVPFTTWSGVIGPIFMVASNTGFGSSLTSSITGQSLYFANKSYVSSFLDVNVLCKNEYAQTENASIRVNALKYVHRKMGSRAINYFASHVFISFKEKNTFTQVLPYTECGYDADGYFTQINMINFLTSFNYFPSIKVIDYDGSIFIKDIKESVFYINA